MLKARERRRKVKDQKNRGNKQNTGRVVADINPTVSITTLITNDLATSEGQIWYYNIKF